MVRPPRSGEDQSMSGLIIAADLGALGDAARSLGGVAAGSSDRSGSTPSLGHADSDAALADFHSAMREHSSGLAGHAAQGAASMHGYLLAFHTAGD